MSLVKNDHVIETLAANATNHPFDVRILPWRARRGPNLVDAESRDAPAEVRSIDSISVSQHEARSTLPGKGIDDLLRGPHCRRVVCDIEVSDPSPIVTEYDEDEENRNVAVGNVKKSTETKSLTWLSRKLRHV